MFITEVCRKRCARRPPLARTIVVICLSLLTGSINPPLNAQKIEKVERKLIRQVNPDYPGDLKRAFIGGMVRLDIVVSPGGSVNTISVVGGNPILADCAVNVRVNVKFDPRH